VAVELALRGLKINPGDEVILAGYDFPGNFRCIEAVGALPVLVDIDPATWCLDPAAIESAVGPNTRGIIVSHLHGGIAHMRQIREIADARELAVVEDACQVPGAIVDGKVAGTWGDVGIMSFGGSKLLTAGRGGALVIKDASVLQRIKIFCERGNDAFPLSELQAAVLIPQLEKLESRNVCRLENVKRLLDQCGEEKGLRPLMNHVSDSTSSFYKLAWFLEPEWLSRDEFVPAMQAEGVALDTGFRGFAGRPAKRCRQVGDLPHSRQASRQTVVQHHPVLLEPGATIDLVADALRKVLTALRKESKVEESKVKK